MCCFKFTDANANNSEKEPDSAFVMLPKSSPLPSGPPLPSPPLSCPSLFPPLSLPSFIFLELKFIRVTLTTSRKFRVHSSEAHRLHLARCAHHPTPRLLPTPRV